MQARDPRLGRLGLLFSAKLARVTDEVLTTNQPIGLSPRTGEVSCHMATRGCVLRTESFHQRHQT